MEFLEAESSTDGKQQSAAVQLPVSAIKDGSVNTSDLPASAFAGRTLSLAPEPSSRPSSASPASPESAPSGPATTSPQTDLRLLSEENAVSHSTPSPGNASLSETEEAATVGTPSLIPSQSDALRTILAPNASQG